MKKTDPFKSQAVDFFLNEIAQEKTGVNYSELFDLLQIALKRHLLAEAGTLKSFRENAQDVSGASLHQKAALVADWLQAARHSGEPFLADTVNGKPKKLLHLQSVEHACAEAEKYLAKPSRRSVRSFSCAP